MRNTLTRSGGGWSKTQHRLGANEAAIYQAVIREWTSGNPTSLNVSARTFSLQANLDSTALMDCACSVEIEPESLFGAAHSSHQLSADMVGRVRLVDPHKEADVIQENDPQEAMGHGMSAFKKALASGIFSLSEIAFDKEHKHAIVSFSFSCGSLCGTGSTWIFEKIGGEWKQTDRKCGGWVSQTITIDPPLVDILGFVTMV